MEKRLAQLRVTAAEKKGVAPEEVDMTNIEAFYVLQSTYIDAALDEINKQHGSMRTYLRQGLGLTDAEIQRLQDGLLERQKP